MILFFEQELPHYRVPVFAALQADLSEDLIVCASQPPVSSNHITRDDEIPFVYMELRTFWFAGTKLYAQDWFAAFRRFGLPDVVLVRHAIGNLTLFPLFWFCQRKDIPIVVWGQGYSRNRSFAPGKNLFDKIHLSIVRQADAYVCYTANVHDTLAQHVDSDKLFVATNTLDTRQLLDIRQRLTIEGKEAMKRRLGLDREYYLSFIGRLQPRKQVPYLLEVYALLKQKHRLDVGLVIVGKGDQEPLREQVTRLGVGDVHILGALPDEKAGEYLFASDVMVMPGWLGLAVNHAFAFGLPVVSQRFGEHLLGHGPEAAYVTHGVTGWFAQEGDKQGMARGIVKILAHKKEYSTRVSEYVENHLRIERMVEGFTEAIAYAKAIHRSEGKTDGQ